MPSLDTSGLPKPEQDAIRLLHKTVRATCYDDPVDQDAFLVASAHSVLALREHVVSFASSQELSKCVFTIRIALHQNNSRFESTSGEVLAAISDFAGEIVRSHQLIRDCHHAQCTRLRAEAGAAARAEHREALQYANKKRALSPDEDTVSIPSDDEESFHHNACPISLAVEPSSPVNGNDTTAVPSPVQAGLSVITNAVPAGLVPTSPPSNELPANGCDWRQKKMHPIPYHRGCIHLVQTEHSAPRVHCQSEANRHGPGASYRHCHPEANCFGPGTSYGQRNQAWAPPSEPQLYRRLADIEAEVQRLSAAQEYFGEQLQLWTHKANKKKKKLIKLCEHDSK
ncbi:hypothetical protein FB451DRAFT_1193839 [Mycena latifolia]|nr:hypothetical protein FB451DRAFT_1193839 [Mycena latifolia]